jgi:hypothetical protein
MEKNKAETINLQINMFKKTGEYSPAGNYILQSPSNNNLPPKAPHVFFD